MIEKWTTELIKIIIGYYKKGNDIPYSAFGKYYSRSLDDRLTESEGKKGMVSIYEKKENTKRWEYNKIK